MSVKINKNIETYYSFADYLLMKGQISPGMANDLKYFLYGHPVEEVHNVVKLLNNQWNAIYADLKNGRQPEVTPNLPEEKERAAITSTYTTYIASETTTTINDQSVIPIVTTVRGESEFEYHYYNCYQAPVYEIGGQMMSYYEALEFLNQSITNSGKKVEIVGPTYTNLGDIALRGLTPEQVKKDNIPYKDKILNEDVSSVIARIGVGNVSGRDARTSGNSVAKVSKSLEVTVSGSPIDIKGSTWLYHRIIDPKGVFPQGYVSAAYGVNVLNLDFSKNNEERYAHFKNYLLSNPDTIINVRISRKDRDALQKINKDQDDVDKETPWYTYFSTAFLQKMRDEPERVQKQMFAFLGKCWLYIVPGGEELCLGVQKIENTAWDDTESTNFMISFAHKLHIMLAFAKLNGKPLDIKAFVTSVLTNTLMGFLGRITAHLLSFFSVPIKLKGKVSERNSNLGVSVVGFVNMLANQFKGTNNAIEDMTDLDDIMNLSMDDKLGCKSIDIKAVVKEEERLGGLQRVVGGGSGKNDNSQNIGVSVIEKVVPLNVPQSISIVPVSQGLQRRVLPGNEPPVNEPPPVEKLTGLERLAKQGVQGLPDYSDLVNF